jgi:regulator of RNase E activity RraA
MSLTDRLEACYTGAVFDVLRGIGRVPCVLPPEIRPLDPTRSLAGMVFTVRGHAESSLDPHETLLRWTAMLSRAPADHVVVCQPHDGALAHMGELSAETLQFRGIRGYIVDGGCRDVNFILRIGFRVFCRYTTPMDIVGRWVADAFNEPVRIGDVEIRAGDYVLGDRDGVVVVPGDIAEEVTAKAETLMKTENLVRRAILQGVDPQEAYLKHGAF